MRIKMTKPIVCLITAVLMMLSIAACGSNSGDQSAQSGSGASNQSSAASSDNSNASQSGSSGAASRGWKPQSDVSKPIKFTYGSVQAIAGYNYTSGDALAKFYSKKFNYTMNVSALNWDNWNQNMRIWINSGDMPDVGVYNFKYPDAANFVQQGLLKKLPEDWKKLWPHLAAVYDKTELGPELDKKFGGTYFIPRARFMYNFPGKPGGPVPDHPSLYIRGDWAKAVGFPLKPAYTTSDVMKYAELIKQKDPGHIGSKLIPLAEDTTYAVELFVKSNSTYFNGFYKGKDGKYKWGGASPDTLKGLELMSKAYREGLLAKDFYTVKNSSHATFFNVNAVAGATFDSAPTAALQSFYDTFKQNTGLDPYKSIHMATLLGDDGHFHQQDLINYWGTVIFNPNISKAKLYRYMDILDYNATKEGQIINNMGIKDVDWKYGSDGKVVSLYDAKKAGKPLGGTNGKYPSLGYLLGTSILFDDFAFDNPNSDPRLRDLSKQLYASRTQAGTSVTFPQVNWDLYTYSSPSMNRAQMDYYTEYAHLVTMPGDIKTNWQNWVKSKMPLIQPVLNELNAKLAK